MQDSYEVLVEGRAQGVLITLLLIVLLLFLWDNLPRSWKTTANAQSAAQSRIRVWVNRRSGFYYCPGSKLYGKLEPGFFTSQGEALQTGYRPPFNDICQIDLVPIGSRSRFDQAPGNLIILGGDCERSDRWA